MKIKQLSLFLVMSGFIASCRQDTDVTNKKAELDTVIPGANTEIGTLGAGFNSVNSQLMQDSYCINFETDMELGNTEATLEFKKDMTFEDAKKALAGDINADASFSAVKISAGAKILTNSVATKFSTTSVFNWTGRTKSARMKPSSLKVKPEMEDIIKNKNNSLFNVCGDEYISQIDYGASFLASMKVEFRNETERNEYGGNLDVDIAGKVKVSGKLEKADEDTKNGINITIFAYQNGGDPNALLSTITGAGYTCTVATIDKCSDMMTNIVNYATNKDTGFASQLKDTKKWNVLRYVTGKYGVVAGVNRLVPNAPTPIVSQAITSMRIDLEKRWAEEIDATERANKLLSSALKYMSEEQKTKVISIKENAPTNARKYVTAIDYCYKNANEECLDRGNEAIKYAESPEHKSDLEALKVFIPTPKEMEDKMLCESSMILLKRHGQISDRYFRFMKEEMVYPFYNKVGDRNSFTKGNHMSCNEVVDTY